jgi:hypothetical protein
VARVLIFTILLSVLGYLNNWETNNTDSDKKNYMKKLFCTFTYIKEDCTFTVHYRSTDRGVDDKKQIVPILEARAIGEVFF